MGHLRHCDEPRLGATVPEAQGVHSEAPTIEENVPEGHLKQRSEPGAAKVPALQLAQRPVVFDGT